MSSLSIACLPSHSQCSQQSVLQAGKRRGGPGGGMVQCQVGAAGGGGREEYGAVGQPVEDAVVLLALKGPVFC